MGAALWNHPAARILRRRLWPAVAPAALIWADESWRHLRRALPVTGMQAAVPAPPESRMPLTPVIERWLGWRGATCLERSMIMQRWLMAKGQPHDLLIGVQRPGDSVIAHAWLDHEDSRGYAVLLRRTSEELANGMPAAPVGALRQL